VNKSIININLVLIALHMAFGFLMLNSTVSKSLNILLLFVGFMNILATRNKNQEAMLWSAYVVGSEVLFRMSKGLIFYEFPKYMVFLFLLTGLLIEKKRHNISHIFIIYILLLLFGITFSEIPYPHSIRTNIIFNLSGPILLGMSATYMYERKVPMDTVFTMLKYFGLPIISMVIYIYFKVPDLKFINFGGVSNRVASGGYGPNQVATILGLGMFAFAAFLIMRKRFSGYFIVDFSILLYVTYRCLITLSRGGLMTGMIAISALVFFYTLSKKDSVFHFLKYIVIVGVLSVPLFMYTSELTNGMLLNRYTNKNARGVEKEDFSAGRFEVFNNELDGFYNNPFFGIGVGSGKFKRIDELGFRVASHNEMSRLLGEHGMMGLFIIFLLITIPLTVMYRQPTRNRAFLSAFFILWFLTINHSAMRLAMPGFLYGLAVMTIINEKEYELIEIKKDA
jgi:hypothetical protein